MFSGPPSLGVSRATALTDARRRRNRHRGCSRGIRRRRVHRAGDPGRRDRRDRHQARDEAPRHADRRRWAIRPTDHPGCDVLATAGRDPSDARLPSAAASPGNTSFDPILADVARTDGRRVAETAAKYPSTPALCPTNPVTRSASPRWRSLCSLRAPGWGRPVLDQQSPAWHEFVVMPVSPGIRAATRVITNMELLTKSRKRSQHENCRLRKRCTSFGF